MAKETRSNNRGWRMRYSLRTLLLIMLVIAAFFSGRESHPLNSS